MLLAVTLTISVSPHEYNNLKLMYFWYALSSVLIAAWLVTLGRVKGRPWTAFSLSVVCVLTGLLSLHAEAVLKWEIFSNADVQASVFVKHMTPPNALWLTGLNHNQPIASLAGRTIVLGYTGWIVSHGYDVGRREADVRTMYTGGPKAAALLAQYKVDYVYMGPWEKKELKGNDAWYAARYPAVYDVDGLRIYEVAPKQAAMAPSNGDR
jgi:hypothetical protein